MRQTHYIFLACLLLIGSLSFADDDGAQTKSPITLHVTGRSRGKVYSCTADLTLENRHDHPIWFVFAYWGNNLLRHDGDFSAEFARGIPFDASTYDEKKGTAVIVYHYGKDSFKAVLLPPNARFHFAGFVIEDMEPLRFLDIWEVKSLQVNDNTPLEDWIPYSVWSSKSVEIAGKMYSGDQKELNWHHDHTPGAKPYPKESVKSVIAKPLNRFVIPLPE